MTRQELVSLIGDLIFAYANKCEEMPHQFEIEPIVKACDIYLKESKDNKYTEHFINQLKKQMLSQ